MKRAARANLRLLRDDDDRDACVCTCATRYRIDVRRGSESNRSACDVHQQPPPQGG